MSVNGGLYLAKALKTPLLSSSSFKGNTVLPCSNTSINESENTSNESITSYLFSHAVKISDGIFSYFNSSEDASNINYVTTILMSSQNTYTQTATSGIFTAAAPPNYGSFDNVIKTDSYIIDKFYTYFCVNYINQINDKDVFYSLSKLNLKSDLDFKLN